MAQTKEGAAKIAAKKIGIPLDKYKSNIKAALLWCTGCKEWHCKKNFNNDKSRWSGKSQSCREFLKEDYRRRHKPIPPEKRKKMGPPPGAQRPGDKKQARHRVNALVRMGRIPRPNELPCNDCGHLHKDGEGRHEYDHHKGYYTGNHTVVIALCSKCHHRRHPRNGRQYKNRMGIGNMVANHRM